MSSDDVTMAYAGVLPCGCIVAVTVDKPEYQSDNAREVAKWMRQGMTIEHESVALIKANPLFLANCGGEHHHRKARRATAQQIGAGL